MTGEESLRFIVIHYDPVKVEEANGSTRFVSDNQVTNDGSTISIIPFHGLQGIPLLHKARNVR